MDSNGRTLGDSNPPDRVSDEELLVRFRDHRDHSAFDEIVHRYESSLHRYLTSYLRDRSLADDATQATLLRVYQKAHLFDEHRQVRPWVYSIATHQAIDLQRHEGRRRAASLDAMHPVSEEDFAALESLLQSSQASPLECAVEDENRDWTRKAVDHLPRNSARRSCWSTSKASNSTRRPKRCMFLKER